MSDLLYEFTVDADAHTDPELSIPVTVTVCAIVGDAEGVIGGSYFSKHPFQFTLNIVQGAMARAALDRSATWL